MFKVVRVASGAVLAEGDEARATIELLKRIDSIFDVSVEMWHPETKAWRRLTPGEQRTLWNFRRR